MSVAYTACRPIYTRAVFFHVFLKFEKGMPAVSSRTTPLRVYMLQIYSAVILVLAINSLKMKQMVDLFCFAVVKRSRGELIPKYCRIKFYRVRIRLWTRKKKRFGIILEYVIILQWTSLVTPPKACLYSRGMCDHNAFSISTKYA